MCKKLIYLLSLVFVLSMVLTGSADAADPNLLLWLEFEGDANDSSNYGRHGLVTGSLTYGTGVIGQAADLDGSANYVTIPGYKGVLGPNAFSITAWCLPDSGNDGIAKWNRETPPSQLVFVSESPRGRHNLVPRDDADSTVPRDKWNRESCASDVQHLPALLFGLQ